MRGWLVALAFVASCRPGLHTNKRELFRANVDGADIVVGAELHGWHSPGHPGPNLDWMPARDDFAIYESIVAKRRIELSVFDTSEVAFHAYAPAPASSKAGRDELAALSVTKCALSHGVAFRAKNEWSALYVLGDRVFRTKLDSTATDCAALGAPKAEDVLAAAPGGTTTCLALDEAGFRAAAIDCILQGTTSDLHEMAALPKEGPAAPPDAVSVVLHVDRDALLKRLAADPSAVDAMIDRLATKPPPYGDITIARERLLPLDEAHALSRFADRVIAQCANPAGPCMDDIVKLGELAIGWKGTAFVTPAACAQGIAFAQTLAKRPEPDAPRRAFYALRGFYECPDASARPLMIAGLSVATSADTKLASPDYTSYSGIDSNCQPFTGNKGQEVSSLCESFPRFAGTWLSAHCGADAIAAASKIARDKPREPFDPREDQVLDGALRVLGKCDAAAFEAAIAHVPATVTGEANIRSREHLRAAFVK